MQNAAWFAVILLPLSACTNEVRTSRDEVPLGLSVETLTETQVRATVRLEDGLILTLEAARSDTTVTSTVRDAAGRPITQLTMPATDDPLAAASPDTLRAAVDRTRAELAAGSYDAERAAALLPAYGDTLSELLAQVKGSAYPVEQLQLDYHIPVLVNALETDFPAWKEQEPMAEMMVAAFVPLDRDRVRDIWAGRVEMPPPGEDVAFDYGPGNCGGCFGACGPNCDYCAWGWLCYYHPVCYAHDVYCCYMGGTVGCGRGS